MVTSIDVATLRNWLHDGKEIAVIDINDGGPFSRGHILIASNVPPASFEVLLPQLVPQRRTRLILVDEDGTRSTIVAQDVERTGYTHVHVLEGGNVAWSTSGYRLFSGSNIVSKAFGELVELTLGTPHLEPEELASWQSEGKDFILIDARPLAEYRTVSLPGATDCPGAELVYRVPALIDNPTIPVVVNCAGRTRSIIGAQSLRDAGLSNPVFALKNGTMGWQIAGLTVSHGQSNMVPEPQGQELARAQLLAQSLATRDDIRLVNWSMVEQWRKDTSRTTYLFDVRQADAFEMAHIPGSVNAPGGQLIQTTDMFAAVRNARIVLIDEHHVQSVLTAHWLQRMGWEVAILENAVNHMNEKGFTSSEPLCPIKVQVTPISALDLQKLIADNACEIVDVGESYWYRQGRIPGSWYSMRVNLETSLTRFPVDRTLVFVCTNGTVSPHIAGDATDFGFTDIRYLRDGRAGWRRENLPMEVIDVNDDEKVLTPTDDMWYPPWARKEGAREAMIKYLTWETGLLDLTAEETYLQFSI